MAASSSGLTVPARNLPGRAHHRGNAGVGTGSRDRSSASSSLGATAPEGCILDLPASRAGFGACAEPADWEAESLASTALGPSKSAKSHARRDARKKGKEAPSLQEENMELRHRVEALESMVVDLTKEVYALKERLDDDEDDTQSSWGNWEDLEEPFLRCHGCGGQHGAYGSWMNHCDACIPDLHSRLDKGMFNLASVV